MAPLPQGLSYEEAAALPTVALTALQGLLTMPFAAADTLVAEARAGGLLPP